VIALIMTVLFAPVAEQQLPGIGAWSYVLGALFAVLLYASVLVHELGHSVVARRYGVPVRRIHLQLFGGVSELDGELKTPGQAFMVAVVGPVLSLALGALGWVALVAFDTDGALRLLLIQLTAANLLVGVFNLLPGYPLDGGHLVRAGVWRFTGSSLTGLKAAAYCGRGVAVLAFAFPFVWSGLAGTSPDLISVAWGALVAAFIWAGAGQALTAARQQQVIPTLAAGALVRRAIPVVTGTPLALALDQLSTSGARALVVVDRADRPIGIVSEKAVAAVPIERRPWVEISTVARRLTPAMRIPVTAAGADLLDRLATAAAPDVLVVDADDLVVGVLSAADIGARMTSR
jgi:Zn-dependent protease